MQIAAIPTLFIVTFLNRFKYHWLCLFAQLIGQLCVILNSFLSGSIFNIFFISFIRVFILQTFWTIGNSIVFEFMQEKKGEKKWRKNTATTIFMGSWTFSGWLFLIAGVLIDTYGFRETTFFCAIITIISSIVMFYRVPAISLNDFLEIEHVIQTNGDKSKQDETGTSNSNSLLIDFKVLCFDPLCVVIMFNTLTCVTNWGMYYGSFGTWLKQLFHLNAQRLGVYCTICEALAETVALCAIPICSRYVSNGTLCIIGGILETSSVVGLNIILWNDGYVLNNYILTLGIEWIQIGIILLCIFCFYMGHEFLYTALLVNLDIVPKKQHSTAVAMYGVFDFMGAFIGQIFVTYIFTKDGMIAMAPYMLMVECISVTCLITMNIILCKREQRKKRLFKQQDRIGINTDNNKAIKKIKGDVLNGNANISKHDGKLLIESNEKNGLLAHPSDYS